MHIQYTVPTKFQEADFGTIIKVSGDNDTFHLWIQVEHKQEAPPHWISSGEFFSMLWDYDLEDKKFVDECLRKYLTSSKLNLV
jgi:hypothetical protein